LTATNNIPSRLGVGIALKHSEASEIVGLSLKRVGDFRFERFLAVLKKLEELAVSRQLVVAGFMELQNFLLGLTDAVVDVND
jgi:hypothetical protein